MTGKLEGFQAISTNTTTNGYCQKQYKKQDPKNICTFCYSHEMLNTFRKNMAPALQRNTDLLNSKYYTPMLYQLLILHFLGLMLMAN